MFEKNCFLPNKNLLVQLSRSSSSEQSARVAGEKSLMSTKCPITSSFIVSSDLCGKHGARQRY